MQVDHYVTLHLTATQAEVIPAMQGDGARCLLASLMANGEPWAVPEGTSVGIAYTLPDKSDGYYNQLTDGSPAATVAGNLVTVTLAPVLTEQAGTAKLSLVLRQGERQIATFPLQLKVQTAVGKVLGEDVPVQTDGFEGKLYYGGPGGTIIPLALGPGLAVRDGTVVVEGAERPGADSGQNPPQGGLTTAQINALDGMFKVCAFVKADVSPEYNAFRAAFNLDSTEGGETPDKTLTSISATYSGGSVPVGTAVSALTGIVVTAHYSDGSTATVTGYTLSGTIAEGSNTITVTYQGKTAAFTVTGVSESGGAGTAGVVNLFDKDTMVIVGKAVGNNNAVIVQATGKAAKIPIVAGKTYAVSKTGGVWINFQVGNVIFVDDSETLVDSFAFGSASQVTPVEGTYYPPNINGSLAGSKGLTTAYLDTNNRGFTFTAPEGATHIMFTLCWSGGADCTDTLMFETGDTCHDYVAYVS